MENVQKTSAEITQERIMSAPLDPEYEYDPDIPIPTGHGLLIKKINQTPMAVLDSGIILMEGNNSHPPHIGIVQCVGPECSKFTRAGLRCYYNFFVDSFFRFGGVDYAKCHENDLFYYIPPKTIVFDGVKDEKQVRREKKSPILAAGELAVFKRDENEKDKRLDKTKGKTFKLK